MLEINPLTCWNCGGQIDRATRKCPYCGTQYEMPEGIKIVVDRPGVHKIRCQATVSQEMIVRAPEKAMEKALAQMRKQVADGLLEYMRFVTEDDRRTMCQIIRGEVSVLEPRDDIWR